MSGGSTVQRIDALDAFARTLYLRAKQSGLPFTDVATAVRNLHIALRHLRIEAADQDSVLSNVQASSSSSSVYSRQLEPLVDDCEFTLGQLERHLDKYGDGRAVMPEDERQRDQELSVIKHKLAGDKTSVEMFLDAVQLHAENRPTRVVEGQAGLERIKDVVDEIATKLFRNRNEGSFTEDEDGLWREFKVELEDQGFSPQVLRKHKDVLRAYVRELESVQNQYGGNYPTVRGLLEHEARSQPTSPQELDSSPYRKYPPVIITGGRGRSNSDSAREPISSSPRDADNESDYSMAMVSTQDLLAMDSLNTRMANLNVQGNDQYSLSPGHRQMPPNSLPDVPELSTSPITRHIESSPRSMPPMPHHISSGPPSYGSSPRSSAPRLAPDRWGNEIPPDAQWTRIRRELVSPEVLERAGVRYEARPDYVAVLGRLTREQVSEFARESAACRAARSRRGPPPRKHDHHSERRDSKSSREDDDDDSGVFDESDISDDEEDKSSEKGTKSYPYIVNPPTKNPISPSSTTMPKPILKNKNENHVRFDPEPYEVDARSPRSYRDDRHRDRDHDHHPLGAVGIGGAAVSLLSVLAEAAS
ncbi:hypothetical protein FPRO04_05686 [Fusarium proliferatum]|uniref:DUF8035 domain-containing protein n=1 Tax=Gibberella intermedia TaxID=948311 RepID=A0A365MNY3_GIBIN|nr:hypothetical protein FPRO03_09516 [Fusarium proliferatum]KAG4280972.1 hypothetical protein FPRO04_05686 [Fusarium proliferatum]RBA10142.1 hypothetical protein FPRO05_06078 [Fusarium proliferatum]